MDFLNFIFRRIEGYNEMVEQIGDLEQSRANVYKGGRTRGGK